MPFAAMRNLRRSRMGEEDDEFGVGLVKSQVPEAQPCRVIELWSSHWSKM